MLSTMRYFVFLIAAGCAGSGPQPPSNAPISTAVEENGSPPEPPTDPKPKQESFVPQLFLFGWHFKDEAGVTQYTTFHWQPDGSIEYRRRYAETRDGKYTMVNRLAMLRGQQAESITSAVSTAEAFQRVTKACRSMRQPVGDPGKVYRYRLAPGAQPLVYWCAGTSGDQLPTSKLLVEWDEKILQDPDGYRVYEELETDDE